MDENMAAGGEPVVEVRKLTRKFRRKVALDEVSFEVPRGSVFGLVGENGAGKTTLVKHLLGVLKAQSGDVRVFGKDPVDDPVGVLSQIGYLSEDRDLPGWMRVGQLMRYTQAFYPDWDEAYAEHLRKRFELPLDARIKHLSRGEKAKAGLLVAIAYRPAMLLLDEPSSGLDAGARRDILGAIIRTVADEGRTVFFSSHLLEEVERVADIVCMLHEGKVVFCGPLAEIKARHRRVVLRFDTPQETPPAIPGVLHCEGQGREWAFVCDRPIQEFAEEVARHNATIVDDEEPSLERLFLARVGHKDL